MNSKFTIVLILLLMFAGVGQALAATITATPSNVPKGAYLNGPGGATDDNYFFQTVILEAEQNHALTENIVITLPDGMTIADTDNATPTDWTDEVSVSASVALTSVVATASTITIDVAAAFNIGATATVMFPVVTEEEPADLTQDYWVDFNATTNDDIANESGYFVTFVDPGPTAVSLVSFEDNLSADDDSTNAKGDRYPTDAVATFDALPDLVVETANEAWAANAVTIGYPIADGAENSNETTYTVWISTNSALAHVDSLTAGVFHAETYQTMVTYIQDELGTGNTRYNLSGYPEGYYYFYITSYLTGDFPLARSDKLYIRHWPVINAAGWDYDHDGIYEPGAPGTLDDQAVTLDSGRYFDYTGTAAASGHYTFLDVYSHVDDLDDNAKVHLFYSADAALDTTDVVKSGSSGDGTLAITSLTGATLIAANLLENSEDIQGFIRYRWSMDPDTTGVHPAANLTVYCVTCDGKHIDMTPVKGVKSVSLPVIESGVTSLLTYIKNSPRLKLDVLTEYDSDVTGDIDINVQDHDQIMISWAKSGVGGDIDIDDSATISLYINNETDNPAFVWNLSDYGHDSAVALRAAATAGTYVHEITTGLAEDSDSKSQSWYAWYLKNDTWYPNPAKTYIIYAIIDDGRTAPNTSIVTSILTTPATYFTAGTNLSAGTGIGQEILFTNSEFARLIDPPAEGLTVNAEETFRLRFSAFDWDQDGDVGIFIMQGTNATTTTISVLTAAGVNAYCLTSTDGTRAGGAGLWKSEDSDTYYDALIRTPGAAATYTLQMDGNGPALADGTYWVYIGIDPINANNFAAGTEVLYRAPGSLTIINAANTAIQRNLTVSPMEVTVAEGDTVTFSIKGVIPALNTVDRIDAYIAVEKDWWDVVSPSTPFTAASAFAGKLLTNTVIDDTAGDRWILRTVVSDAGSPTQFNTLPTSGVGNDVATFKLVSKGTDDALQHLTSVYFVNEPANSRVTKFSNDGNDVSINTLASTVKVGPRAIVEGIVELQGRTVMNTTMTFELRERGGYDNISDALFYSTNDLNGTDAGVQYTPDADGKFSLYNIPTGEYDLAVMYNRYLSKLVQVDVYPGIDTLFVSFDVLKGGDCFGYTDVLGNVYPNNKIDVGDINRIQTAFLATSSDPEWNDGTNNWKWADINEDNVIEVDDLSMATGNEGSDGAQPVFEKPAVGEKQSDEIAFIEFMNVPNQFKAGQTYTIQVVGNNITGARAYFVNMNYDREALEFAGIVKGDIIKSDSYSFPVVGENSVGFANSIYGENTFSSNGILAEVMFTAKHDGAFTADLLSFERATVVNANYISEGINFEPVTAIGSGDMPVAFTLGQNFPNPFNPTTAIGFSVPENGYVSIKVFDILGRHVRTLVDRDYTAGNYSVMWDSTDMNGDVVSNGIYFYTIEAGNFHATKRMLLLK